MKIQAAASTVFRTTRRGAAGKPVSGSGPRLRPCRRWSVVGAGLVIFAVATFAQAQASVVWEGGDWAGRDFTPANGDILSGTFINIGRFLINTGDTVSAGSGLVSLITHDSIINGALYGGPALAPRLELTAQTGIILNGALDQWSYISLSLTSLGNITVSGSISILDSSGNISQVGLPSGGVILTGRSFLIAKNGPTPSLIPLPPALLLFAPGLAGMLYVRRKLQR